MTDVTIVMSHALKFIIAHIIVITCYCCRVRIVVSRVNVESDVLSINVIYVKCEW